MLCKMYVLKDFSETRLIKLYLFTFLSFSTNIGFDWNKYAYIKSFQPQLNNVIENKDNSGASTQVALVASGSGR